MLYPLLFCVCLKISIIQVYKRALLTAKETKWKKNCLNCRQTNSHSSRAPSLAALGGTGDGRQGREGTSSRGLRPAYRQGCAGHGSGQPDVEWVSGAVGLSQWDLPLGRMGGVSTNDCKASHALQMCLLSLDGPSSIELH